MHIHLHYTFGLICLVSCLDACTVRAERLHPTTEKILAPAGSANAWFGGTFALDDDVLAIGEERSGFSRRTVKVFRRTRGGWEYETAIRPDNIQTSQKFGSAIAIDGSTLVIGDSGDSPREVSGFVHSLAGAAYVFEEDSSGWTQSAKLTLDDFTSGDLLGKSVSISHDTIVLGARSDKGAFQFQQIGDSWQQISHLTPSVPDGSDLDGGFADNIAFNGRTILVSAHVQDAGQTNSGAVFAYDEGDFGWRESHIFTPPDPLFRGKFGSSIDISNDAAIIGRPAGGSAASGPFQGAAYIYEEIAGERMLSATLRASDGFEGDGFGARVAISDKLAAVSASGRTNGRVYLFKKSQDQWEEIGWIESGQAFDSDQYGEALAVNNFTVAVGARLDSEQAIQAGAVYVYRIPEPSTFNLAAILGSITIYCVIRQRHPSKT